MPNPDGDFGEAHEEWKAAGLLPILYPLKKAHMQRSLGDGGYEDIEREKVVRGRLGEMGMRWALDDGF